MKESPIRAAVLGGLILLAASSASADDEGGTPAPAAVPAARDSAPKRAAAEPTMDSVAEARQSERYEEAIEGARLLAAKNPPPEPRDLMRLALIEAESCLSLERHEEALPAADRCLGLLNPEGTNWEIWFQRASSARAWALHGCGRTADAAATLDDLVRRFPATATEVGISRLRSLFKAGDGFTVDPTYAGALAKEPGLPAAIDRLRRNLAPAAARLRARLGTPDLPMPPMVVRLQDGALDSADGVMYAMGFRRGAGWVGLVTVNDDFLLADDTPEVEVAGLSHEMTHVLRGQGTGKPSVPPWVEEGLAEWVDDDGEREMWDYLFDDTFLPRGPGALRRMPKSLHPDRPWAGRPYETQRVLGKVLFHYLEATRSVGAVRKYALALIRTNEEPVAAFRAAFGGAPDELQRELAERFLVWASKSLDGFEGLEALDRAFDGGDPEAAKAACEEFLAKHPGSPLRVPVRLRFAWVLVGMRRGALAAEVLADIRAREKIPIALRPIVDTTALYAAFGRGDGAEISRLAIDILRSNPGLRRDLREMVEMFQGSFDKLPPAKPPAKEPNPGDGVDPK